MRLLHRLTAALSALLILQLTLQASGMSCTMRGAEMATKTRDMSGMIGMSTPGAARTTPPASGHSDDGCRMPWMPGQCTSMTACTMAAMPSATLVTALGGRPVAPDLPMPRALGSRPAAPPELPPPRA